MARGNGTHRDKWTIIECGTKPFEFGCCDKQTKVGRLDLARCVVLVSLYMHFLLSHANFVCPLTFLRTGWISRRRPVIWLLLTQDNSLFMKQY